MPAAEDVDHDGVDEGVHSDDMVMKRFFQVFEVLVMEFERFESFLEISGIYPVMKVRGFFLFFEEIEHIFAVFPEKRQKDHDYDKDNQG